VAGAGVEGAFDEDAAAGVALGYVLLEGIRNYHRAYSRTFETMQTMNPFSSIL
jgi:hypothetical protein